MGVFSVIRRFLRLFVLGFLAAGALAIAARGGEPPPMAAEALRVEAAGEGARVTLDLSGRPGFRYFTLSDPDRLVVDLPRLDWRIDGAPAVAGPVAAARFGLYSADASRLVLDLREPARVARAFTAGRPGGGARLVLELAPEPRAAFDDAAGFPPWAAPGPAPGAPAPRGGSGPLVMLDPGHGGLDPGAIRGEVTEKSLALAFARALRDALLASGRYRVVMTRDRDVFLSLRDRVRAAQETGADLFISLHANTVTRGSARGAAVYTLSGAASDAEARALAELENRSDILAGVNLEGAADDVARVLIDLSQRRTNAASVRLAQALVPALARRVGVLAGRPHRAAGFRVLKSPQTPSVLLEMGFMTDDGDLRDMQDPAWRERAAASVIEGLDRWAAREGREAARR